MKIKNISHILLLIITLGWSLASNAEAVWVDVRSLIEHKIDHIEGDVRIPHDEIVAQVVRLFPNKETEIRLYCRSGNRAGKAMTALNQAGYHNVFNVGSIGEARQERGIAEL